MAAERGGWSAAVREVAKNATLCIYNMRQPEIAIK